MRCVLTKTYPKHEEMDNFRINSLNITPQQMKKYKNVQLTMMYHHSVERIVEKAKKVLENNPSEINKEFWQKDIDEPQEYWEYTGVNYFHNTLTDRIRIFSMDLYACSYTITKKNRQDRNFISKHWIDVCDLIERSQAFSVDTSEMT